MRVWVVGVGMTIELEYSPLLVCHLLVWCDRMRLGFFSLLLIASVTIRISLALTLTKAVGSKCKFM